MGAVVLYDWAHPHQQSFARLSKYLQRRSDRDRKFRDYHAHLYSDLATQRRAIKQELHEALCGSCLTRYAFTRWQRTIRWKYSDHPLCTLGSLACGGRFNIGSNIDPTTFPPFSAFYSCEDQETALLESLGKPAVSSPLDVYDLALARKESIVTLSLSGEFEQVVDLRNATSLRELARLMKGFKVSRSVASEAKGLPVVAPAVIKTARELLDSLLAVDWRHTVTLCGIPANSQVFGQIVQEAGIEAILYPSRLTGRDCLAIFPRNFAGGRSFIAVDGVTPTLVGPRRIAASNWEACERSADSLPRPPARRRLETA